MYKLIALDIDDTVLDSRNLIPPEVLAAVERARAAGIVIVVATGRPYRSALRAINELGVSGHAICYAGAVAVDHPSGIVEYSDPLSECEVRGIVKFADEMGVYAQVYEGDDYFFYKETEYSLRYANGSGYHGIAADIGKRAFLKSPKVLIIDDDRIPELLPVARERFSGLNINTSKSYFLEFNRPTATKGRALEALAKRLGIGSDEIIAVGDSLIDLSMIEYAGLGVAVGNASEEIKRAADYVCPSNDEGGVAHVINKFIFGEE